MTSVLLCSRPPRLRAGALALILALSACSGDSTGPTDQVTADIGSTLTDEVGVSVGALTVTGALVPFSARVTGLDSRATAASTPASVCVSPDGDLDNADGDAVPDSAVWTFTVPPCSYSGIRGGSLAITGKLELKDPTPASGDFSCAGRLTDLTFAYTNSDQALTYTVVRNGTRSLSGTAAGLTLATNLSIIRSLPDLDATVAKQWTVTFTPAQGSSILINQPLPSGAIDIAGTYGWSRPGETFAMTVSTPVPLRYDATCTGTAQRLSAGELHAAATFNTTTGYVRLTWTGCNKDPDVAFVTTP